MLDNTQNKPSKFRTRNLVEINDESRGTYKDSNQSKFKTSMIRSNLCDCSDAYLLISGTITIKWEEDDDTGKWAGERNKGVIFKYCVSFSECVSNLNVSQIHNAKDIDVVMPMNNLIEYSDIYSKTLGNLRQYYRD